MTRNTVEFNNNLAKDREYRDYNRETNKDDNEGGQV